MKKRTCKGCQALTYEFTCRLEYSIHIPPVVPGSALVFPRPNYECPKPRSYWELVWEHVQLINKKL